MRNKKQFIAGFLCGSILFGSASAFAGVVQVVPSQQKVMINGTVADVRGYNIDGNNYYQLREVGKALNVSVDYESATNTIQVNTDQPYGTIQKTEQTVSMNQADGRPAVNQPKVGQLLYGTGNVSKSSNSLAAPEYDGSITVQPYLKGAAYPTEALKPINPNWDKSYYAIQMPNPMPCYTHILEGDGGDFLGIPIHTEESTMMYVFNAHETQRIIDELYDTFLQHPECYTNGVLNCTVHVGLTGAGLEANYFYPYRDSCVEKMVYARNIDYMVYALDVYKDGTYIETRYICQDNCGPDNKDVISSNRAIIKERQYK